MRIELVILAFTDLLSNKEASLLVFWGDLVKTLKLDFSVLFILFPPISFESNSANVIASSTFFARGGLFLYLEFYASS